jgi:hypothetical protein
MENELPAVEETRDQPFASAEPAEKPGSSLPLILTIIAVLIWFGFQTVQLSLERNNLNVLKANLEAPAQEAQKTRAQLETLISKIVELANQGNANAKAAVEEIEKRGIPVKGVAAPSAK